MMTWEQIRSLHDDGHEIGAHTLTHPSLRRCVLHERHRQIRDSKAAIEAALGDRVRLFSYPFGDVETWDAEVVAEARAAGFDYALTTVSGTVNRAADRWAVPRVCVSREDGITLVQLKRLAPVYLQHVLRRATPPGYRSGP